MARQSIREVMSSDPVVVEAEASVREAAVKMRDGDIGAVIVTKKGTVGGIVTDRDVAVRAVAEGRDPDTATVSEICSGEVVTLSPDDPVDQAVRLMRERAIRRVPVVEGKRPVGMVSIGDLAMERDQDSALADISAAPGNR